MNKNISTVFGTALLVAASARAGLPLNNLQGVGGIAFNPLAYTARLPSAATAPAVSG